MLPIVRVDPVLLRQFSITRNFVGYVGDDQLEPGILVYDVSCGKCRKTFEGRIRLHTEMVTKFFDLLSQHFDACDRLPVMFRRRPEPTPPWCPACGRTYQSATPFARCPHAWHKVAPW